MIYYRYHNLLIKWKQRKGKRFPFSFGYRGRGRGGKKKKKGGVPIRGEKTAGYNSSFHRGKAEGKDSWMTPEADVPCLPGEG